MVVKFVFFLCLYYSLSALANENSECRTDSLEEHIGTYRIKNVTQYRGSLLTELMAKSFIGDRILITKDIFKIWNVVVENPLYKIECHAPLPEGEVPTSAFKFSWFYGVEIDRKFIKILRIYDPETKEKIGYSFEIRNDDEIWYLGSWIYKAFKSN